MWELEELNHVLSTRSTMGPEPLFFCFIVLEYCSDSWVSRVIRKLWNSLCKKKKLSVNNLEHWIDGVFQSWELPIYAKLHVSMNFSLLTNTFYDNYSLLWG